MRVAALLAALAAVGCASAGDPPGGPPDQDPPQVARVAPDSGAVLQAPPSEFEIAFDEVVNERIAAPRPEIAGSLILSPDTGVSRVTWHRNRLTVRPHGGFRTGRIYRVELLPVITDLRQNRLKDGRVIVFSTGPAIPNAALRGAIVDWPGARVGANAFVEAVLLPDSLPYRVLADSSGNFELRQIPPGPYLVYGTIDQDGNRRRGPREAFDTLRVTLDDSSSIELYAFVHDTTAPRIRSAEVADSLTIRLLFDRPLDPATPLDTTMVIVTPASDSTQLLRVMFAGTQRELDSLRAREAAALAAADTSRPRQAVTPLPAGPPQPPGAPVTPARPGAPGPAAPRDSSPAMRMLARRPAPTDARFIRLAEPLVQETRYAVIVGGARSLSGVAGTARVQVTVPKPRRVAPAGPRAPPDTTRPAADTTRATRDTTGVHR